MKHRMTVPVLLLATAGMLSLMGCRNQPPVEEPLAHHTNPVRIEQTTADTQTDPHRTIGQPVLAVLIPLILVYAHAKFHRHFQLRQAEFFSSLLF